MMLTRIRVVVLALVSAVAVPAGAQVFTPTQQPRVRVLDLSADRPLVLDANQSQCAVPPEQKPHRVLEQMVTEAQFVQRSLRQANARRSKAAHVSTANFDVTFGRLRESVVDYSVANRDPKWRAALLKAEVAARDLREQARDLQEANVKPDLLGADERSAVESAGAVLACLADWVTAHRQRGSPSDLGATTKMSWFLPGAGVTPGGDATEVSLKAAEFFFSNHWRLYVHSTITVENPKSAAEEPDAPEDTDDPDDVAESVKTALLNPYGAPLYLTAGYLKKIRTPFLGGDANDGDHGLFFDGRTGLKFVPLPEQTLHLIDGQTANTAFYIGSAALRLRLPLYKNVPFEAGEDGVDVALTAAVNRISNPGASKLFLASADGADPLIPKLVYGAHLAIGISLPKTANIVVSGTLWSNTKFDRRFQIAINLQKSEPEAVTTASR